MDQNSAPYNNVVMIGPGSKMNCTGSLIASNLVLTATHCLQNEDPNNFYVFFGTDISSAIKTKVTDFRNNYLPTLTYGGSMMRSDVPIDYALLKINEIPRAFKSLPVDWSTLPAGTPVLQAGFGTNDNNVFGQLKSNPRQVILPADISRGIEVASNTGTINQGDSGGPLYVKKGTTWHLAGIVSACVSSVQSYCVTGDTNLYVGLNNPTVKSTLLAWAKSMTGWENPFGNQPEETLGEPQWENFESCTPEQPCHADPKPLPWSPSPVPEAITPPPAPPPPTEEVDPPVGYRCTSMTVPHGTRPDSPEPGCTWCVIDGRNFIYHTSSMVCRAFGGYSVAACTLENPCRGVPR